MHRNNYVGVGDVYLPNVPALFGMCVKKHPYGVVFFSVLFILPLLYESEFAKNLKRFYICT